jgi:hypothetical protein
LKLEYLLKTETNSAVYKKVRKKFLAHEGLIGCDRCPYHRIENASGNRVPKPDKHKNHRRGPKVIFDDCVDFSDDGPKYYNRPDGV